MSMFKRKGGFVSTLNLNNNNNRQEGSPVVKDCGHNNCLLSTKNCCSCSDRRTNTRYTKYIDGQGYVPTATRSEHYCPNCRSINNDSTPVYNAFPVTYQPPPPPPHMKPSSSSSSSSSSTAQVFRATPTPTPIIPTPVTVKPIARTSNPPIPTLTEFQMLATIQDMGFSYPAALRALTTIKTASPDATITPELLLNTILEDAEIDALPLPPPPPLEPTPPALPPRVYTTTTTTSANSNNNNTNIPAFTATPVIPAPPTVARTISVGGNLGYDPSCVVCFNNPINSVVIPCGHLAMCMTCAQAVNRLKHECPVCRRAIGAVYQTYHV